MFEGDSTEANPNMTFHDELEDVSNEIVSKAEALDESGDNNQDVDAHDDMLQEGGSAGMAQDEDDGDDEEGVTDVDMEDGDEDGDDGEDAEEDADEDADEDENVDEDDEDDEDDYDEYDEGDEDEEGDEDDEGGSKKGGAPLKKKGRRPALTPVDEEEQEEIQYGIDSEDEDEDEELMKFDESTRKQYLLDFHPEALTVDFNMVRSMCTVVRNADGDIIDELHTTVPVLTKYEKARILGVRAKQLNSGQKALVRVPPHTIDGYAIAQLELEDKVIPFIIRRPMPDGSSEYWRVADLEILYS